MRLVTILLLAVAVIFCATTGTLSSYTAQSDFGVDIVVKYK
jgi:hypothetical protein